MRAEVKVVVVPPAYRSQTCHQCLWLGQREGKGFCLCQPGLWLGKGCRFYHSRYC
ncbi:hypothetical protein [Synechococcus sp. H60.4]|uniref:hypothetical protein n=1 Tax=unclassified Synechococcus TaxID=2626047 RepID=UPI0039C0A689